MIHSEQTWRARANQQLWRWTVFRMACAISPESIALGAWPWTLWAVYALVQAELPLGSWQETSAFHRTRKSAANRLGNRVVTVVVASPLSVRSRRRWLGYVHDPGALDLAHQRLNVAVVLLNSCYAGLHGPAHDNRPMHRIRAEILWPQSCPWWMLIHGRVRVSPRPTAVFRVRPVCGPRTPGR